MKAKRVISGLCAAALSLSMVTAVSASADTTVNVNGKSFTVAQTPYWYDDAADTAYIAARSFVKISEAKVTVSKSELVYAGKAIAPKVTVRYGTEVLKKGKDYTLSYKNAKNTGEATITIKGKGRYTGTTTVNYYIVPRKVSIRTRTYKYNEAGEALWKPIGKTLASGYEVQVSKGDDDFNKYTKTYDIPNGNAKKAVFYNLQRNTTYYVRVRAYVNVEVKDENGKSHIEKKYGAWSSVTGHRRYGTKGCKCKCWVVTKKEGNGSITPVKD